MMGEDGIADSPGAIETSRWVASRRASVTPALALSPSTGTALTTSAAARAAALSAERTVPPIQAALRREGAGKGAGAVAEAEDEEADGLVHGFFPGGVSSLILRPAAESAISVASRRSRVASCLALITHQTAGWR